ncbi:Methyltransferase ausD [Mycena sanguinolenta]|uniref:Methyltransferase ausD n=1 Tax=Mycena sanguinolenta TaxID=230812 RepID=A0A8H7DDJ9_9AGAR|nr:Methyltransferase ausD [Mycena sanguinolenta]
MAQFNLPPLDDSLYREGRVAFIRQETGIQDSEALKQHIIAVQKKAYAVKGFPCVRYFAFAWWVVVWERISELPAYREALKLGREREGAILLDIGCCCGADIRKVARDGWPVQNLIASDLYAGFWDVGHELFRSTPETFPVAFLPGDALDPNFLQPFAPLGAASQLTDSPPALASLTTLTPLRGRLSAIYVSSVFHLLSEAQQPKLAQSLAGLLSPLPGSLIFGCNLGEKVTGRVLLNQIQPMLRFCHSPESWIALWEGIFGKGTVKVEVELIKKREMSDDGVDYNWLVWSVTRL